MNDVARRVRTGRGIEAWFAGVVALLVLAAWALTPAGARAATVRVDPCMDGELPVWEHQFATRTRWDALPGCPATLLQANDLTQSNTWNVFWRHPAPRSGAVTRIVALEAELLGGDGSDGRRTQGVQVCSDQVCGPTYSTSGPNVWEPEPISLTTGPTGGIPSNATHVRLTGDCVRPPEGENCVSGRGLELRNLTYTIEDDDLPTAELDTDDHGELVPPFDPAKWNRGSGTIHLTATDASGGVKRFKLSVNAGPSVDGDDMPCQGTTVIPRLCPPSAEQIFTLGTAQGIKQGANSVTASVLDAVGHWADSNVVEFKYDSAWPNVVDLHATSTTENGWQADQFADVAWANESESEETATQSGVASAIYSAVPVGHAGTSVSGTALGTAISHIDDIKLSTPGWWRITVQTKDAAGNTSYAKTELVGYDPNVPDPPTITPLGVVGGPELAAGKSGDWDTPQTLAQSPSGLCGWAFAVDQSPSTDPGTHPSLPAASNSARLPSMLPEGTNYVHVRAVNCAGTAGQLAHSAFEVDSSAPEIKANGPPASGWYGSDAPFVVRASGDDADLSVAVDGAPGNWSGANSVPVLLADGLHEVTVTARDALGNEASEAFTVKADSNAPLAAIAPPDPNDPTRVVASVADGASGVSQAMLQLRRAGNGGWRQIGEAFQGGFGETDATLEAAIDDAALEPGLYELRVVALDHAGHRSVTTTRLDGTVANLSLPLRQSPQLEASLGVGKANGPAIVVPYGRTARFAGALADATGDPIAHAPIEIVETVVGSPAHVVGAAMTDAGGLFGYRTAPGPSRQIVARYAGSRRLAPAASKATRLLVSGRVTLRAAVRRARGRRLLRFSGQIGAVGAQIPRTGKHVQIQYRLRGRWANFPATIYSTGDRFSYLEEMSIPRRPIRFRFRAVVRAEDGWPYETGVSPTRMVILR